MSDVVCLSPVLGFWLTAFEFRAGKNCDLASALRAAAEFCNGKPEPFSAWIECTDQGWAVYLAYQERAQ